MSVLIHFFIREYLKVFFLILATLSSFYIVIDFFEKLPTFLHSKASFSLFMEYFFYKAFLNLFQIFPYVLGLTPLFFSLFLARTRELIALLTLGVTRKKIFRITLVITIVISILGGVLLNFVLPRAFYKASFIWEIMIGGKKIQFLIFQDTLFFEGKDFILTATPLEPKGEYLGNIALLYLQDHQPVKLIWARSALNVKKDLWRLEDAIFQEVSHDFQPKFVKVWEGILPFEPKALVITEQSVKFASLKELRQRYNYLKQAQKPTTEVWAELFNRLLYLFWGFIIGVFPFLFFIKYYAPHYSLKIFTKGLIIYFSFVVLSILLQTFEGTFLSFTLPLGFLSLILSLFLFLKPPL